MIINTIAKSNAFLFPGSYYFLDVDRLDDPDRDYIFEHENVYKNKSKSSYIFVVYTHDNEHYYENDGVLDGVLGKLVYYHGSLAIHVLCKAQIYTYDDSFEGEMFIDPFVRKLSADLNVYDEIDFLVYRKEHISYSGLYLKKFDEDFYKEETSIQVLNFMNHIFSVENSFGKHFLYENFHYDLYIKLFSYIFKMIKDHSIRFDMFSAYDIETMIKKVAEYIKNDESNGETKVSAINRYLEEGTFFDMEFTKIDVDINIDLITDDSYKHLFHKDISEEEIIKIFLTEPIYDPEKEADIESNSKEVNRIFDIFKPYIKEEAYISSVFRAEKKEIREDLWDKNTLNPVEREKVYYDFLQMSQSNFYKNFKKLSYIPHYIRHMFDSGQSQSGKDLEKEKKRMLSIIRLPWNFKTEDHPMHVAEKMLNEGHYGLNDIKSKILEYLTFLEFSKKAKPKILCLAGPPGVGKSSIAKRIAKALNRRFCSISLGSISTELDLQGANQTYSGASPGGIINQLIFAGSSNPVFLLDEIDKVPERTSNGNIIGILMSILDPTQNKSFIDSFIQVPYDLSQVLFVCTANDITEMSPALLNRVELIHINSYSIKDKKEILKQYVIPEMIDNLDINYSIEFLDQAIELIARNYALDSGMRESVRITETILSKVLMENADQSPENIRITSKMIHRYLGDKLQIYNNYTHESPGIINVLAATTSGGKVMKLEVDSYKGKGQVVTTGNLGKIIIESVNVAMGYLHSHSHIYGINEKQFSNKDFHFHFSDNTSLKDGPSAGVGALIALLSHIKQKNISHEIGFTGEITLKGKILPIGGLINKLSVCAYEGVKKVYLPLANKKEVEKINKDVIKNVDIVFVDQVEELIKELF